MSPYSLALIGFAAFSGTGKTTLLVELIPLLKTSGLRIAVIKHAHHAFDIDKPGKDSHRFRDAGAAQIVVASKNRMAWIKESMEAKDEPSLSEALEALDQAGLDLVLVEGFKHEHFPKIELHRAALGKPLLYPDDPSIIAIATDTSVSQLPASPRQIPQLDINQPQQIADFVLKWLKDG